MRLFAVVTDDDYNYAPMVRLIASGSDATLLQNVTRFDPYGTYSKILKTGFSINQLSPLPLVSTINNQKIAAHICELITC